MRSVSQSCAAFLVILLFAPLAVAKKKSVDLSIWLSQVEGCKDTFYVEQDPHPFLRSVQQVKVRDTVQFRRDGAILENFPDEISLSVNYRPIPGNLYSGITVPCKPFDAGALKFIAEEQVQKSDCPGASSSCRAA
jgi:hypothetical protein